MLLTIEVYSQDPTYNGFSFLALNEVY